MTTTERNTMQATVSFVLNFTDAPGEQEEEIMLLDHFTMLAGALGARCTSAGWQGPTSGAINLHDRLVAEPAVESDAMSPEAKLGVTPPGAGTGAVVPADNPNAGATVPAGTTVGEPGSTVTPPETAPEAPTSPAAPLDLPAPPNTAADTESHG